MTSSGTNALIIGAGLMGRHHASAATKAGAAIACIVDSDLDAAKRLAAKFRGADAKADLKTALNSTRAVIAHVCTPVSSHEQIAVTLADAGLHALIEKPFGANAFEARSIHQCFERAHGGRLACPTHQYAFQRSVARLATLLPKLGPLKSICFDVCSAGAVSGKVSGDELVAEILPHLLAVLQRVLPGISLKSLKWAVVRGADGEWSVATKVGDTLVTMILSAGGRPTRFRTLVTAELGTVEIDHFHDFATLLPGTVSKAQKIMAPFSRNTRGLLIAGTNLLARAARQEFAYPGLQTLVGCFYDAVRKSLPSPITPEQSIDVAEARDAILLLAHNG